MQLAQISAGVDPRPRSRDPDRVDRRVGRDHHAGQQGEARAAPAPRDPPPAGTATAAGG